MRGAARIWLLAAAAGAALLGGATAAHAQTVATTPADAPAAMTQSDHAPCVSPCSKLDLTYVTESDPLYPALGRQAMKLDLYRSPKTPKKDAPVVVLLHGGGFVEGDRTQMRPFGEALARAGFLVASVEYRLVDKARNNQLGIAKQSDIIPAAEYATEDTQAAMRYLRKHAKALGATTDRARYAVGGYSAGAITALRVALRGGDKATPAKRRWKVGAAFSISGFECGSWTLASGCKPAYDAADPPIQLFHGEADTIVPFTWGIQTCTQAVLRGGGCQGYAYPGIDHGWPAGTIFGGGTGLTRNHPAVVPTVAKFLRKHLAS
ncbi:MAG: alpha/beta hydrolase [Solirubrobacteraceae bacterium]